MKKISEVIGQLSRVTSISRQSLTHTIELVYSNYDSKNFPKEFGMMENRKWFLYVYLYRPHKLFESLKKVTNIHDERLEAFGFHGGCTFVQPYHDSSGEVYCLKIGCDFNHDGDNFPQEWDTIEENTILLNTANRVESFLNS